MSLQTPDAIRTLQRKLYGKAKREPNFRFYLLYDKVWRADILRHAYDLACANKGAPGVDGVRFEQIEASGLEDWLIRLGEELRAKTYRPQPVRRVMIPKPGGGERPLGIPTIRDRVAQTAAKLVLEPIFEADLDPAAYGDRPKRSATDAIQAVMVLLRQGHTDVVDADLSKYFNSVDHGWLMRMLAHRIADPRVLRLIERWLEAGVIESGQWRAVEAGTPQGSGISPVLANVFLHCVVDLWVRQWRGRRAVGQVIVCRYADDMVLGCQYEADGKQLLADLKDRLEKFGLSLHEGKTRLIEFGRFAARNRAAAGQRRPETFDFLGFTHYCGKTKKNKFMVKRKTQAKRLRTPITITATILRTGGV